MPRSASAAQSAEAARSLPLEARGVRREGAPGGVRRALDRLKAVSTPDTPAVVVRVGAHAVELELRLGDEVVVVAFEDEAARGRG